MKTLTKAAGTKQKQMLPPINTQKMQQMEFHINRHSTNPCKCLYNLTPISREVYCCTLIHIMLRRLFRNAVDPDICKNGNNNVFNYFKI